jgi:superfamily II DNA helicase RecQ
VYTHGEYDTLLHADEADDTVLLGPEIARTTSFRQKVLQDAAFQKKVALVTVDEAHVVWHWGESFRIRRVLLKRLGLQPSRVSLRLMSRGFRIYAP